MTKIYFAVSITLLSLCVNAQAPTFLWNNYFGNTNSANSIKDIGFDSDGNLIAVGVFSDSVEIDPNPQITKYLISHNVVLSPKGYGYDLFIAKYKKDGSLIWVENFGAAKANFNSNYSLKIDNQNNIIVSGSFNGLVDFDPSPTGVDTLRSLSKPCTGFPCIASVDIFVAKYNSNGGLVWANNIGSYRDEFVSDITTDNSGNFYISGSFVDSVDFNPGKGKNVLYGKNQYKNSFVAKYASNGNYIWAKTLNGTMSNEVHKIACDNSGNLILAGTFYDDIYLLPNDTLNKISAPGAKASSSEIFVSKWDTSGKFIWGGHMGSVSGNDFLKDLKVDKLGNFYLLTVFYSSEDIDFNIFDSSSDTLWFHKKQGGGQYGALTKYSSSGNIILNKIIGASVNNCGIDSYNNIYITGYFNTLSDLDYPNKKIIKPTSGNDVFFAKYSFDGVYFWAYNIAVQSPTISNIEIDKENNFYFTGGANISSNVADFDIGSNTSTPNVNYPYTYLTKYFQCDYNANLTLDKDTLISNVIGANYQWYNSTEKKIVAGATSRKFTPTISGYYKVAILKNGCSDTSTTIYINVCKYFEAKSTLNNDNISLTSNQINNATYEWVNCDLGYLPISAIGAKTSACYPTKNGNYAVIVTRNECVDTSDCILITATGTNTISLENKISVYPNPVTNVLSFTNYSNKNETADIEIIDILGQSILHLDNIYFNENHINTIDVSQLLKGTYFIKIRTTSKLISQKIIKQ